MTNNIPVNINSLRPIWNFLIESRKANNSINNKKLNILLRNFRDSLLEYSNKRGSYTGPLNNREEIFLGFDSDFRNMNNDLYDQRVKELNEIASKAYKDYKILVEFANSMELNVISTHLFNSEIPNKERSNN